MMITQIKLMTIRIDEIMIPATAKPRFLPPICFDLFKPIIEKISPNSGMRNDSTKPAIAIPFDCG